MNPHRRGGQGREPEEHTHEHPGKLLRLCPLEAHLRLDQAPLGSERWGVHSSLHGTSPGFSL